MKNLQVKQYISPLDGIPKPGLSQDFRKGLCTIENLQVTQYISLDGIENTALAKILERGVSKWVNLKLQTSYFLMVTTRYSNCNHKHVSTI